MEQTNKTEDWVLKISQASQLGLLIINYELLLETISDCEKAILDNKNAANLRDKAKSFLQELIYALDMSYEISHTFFDLYIYAQKLIIEGVNQKKSEKLDEAKRIIKSLKDSFESVAEKEEDKTPVIKNAQQIYAGLTYGKTGINESVISGKNEGFKV